MLKLLIATHNWMRRLVLWASVILFFLVALSILILRYWALPAVEQYQGEIAGAIGKAIGEKVEIGNIEADWMGIHPHLVFGQVKIYDRAGNPALSLDRIDSNLSWLTFLTGEIRFSSLEIDKPRLGIRIGENGTTYVAGIPVAQGTGKSALSDWLLHQSRVVIRDGFLLWEDDRSGNPPLMLGSVDFALINSGNHHLFGLRASPPSDLSSPIDLRANLFGDSLNDLSTWRGKFYARVDYANVSRLRDLLPIPRQILDGRGGMRVWLDFSRLKPESVTADFALSGVRARLGSNLPEIGMKYLKGRVGWSNVEGDREFFTRNLSLETYSGERIGPTDFLLQRIPAKHGNAERGQISANQLDLVRLRKLAAYFPLPDGIRKALGEYSPAGRISDLQVNWKGDEPSSVIFPWQKPPANPPERKWPIPPHYSLKARFSNLGLSVSGKEFRGISGNLDGNESGGSLSLDAHRSGFNFPGIFETPVNLDTLTGHASWKNGENDVKVSIENLSFSNPDLSGTAFGTYDTQGNYADFTAKLSKVDAKSVWHYLPLVVGKDARDWVKTGITGGRSDDARFRLKGDLDHFPFRDGRDGIFRTTVHVENGSLAYAPGWPKIESISADLLFEGAGMEIHSSHASILGAKVTRCKVGIANLDDPHAILEVDGDASGPTEEFLRFIDQSPVSGFIGGFTSGMHASGDGSLKLKLHIPLQKVAETRVEGNYIFRGDKVTGTAIPTIENLSGMLEFSEKGVNAKNGKATILGGSTTIDASTRKDGSLNVTLSGKVEPGRLAGPISRHFSGNANWHASLNVHKTSNDLVIESPLDGLTSTLPAPFAKNPGTPLPLRFELKTSSAGEDHATFTLGKRISARFSGETGKGSMSLHSGIVYLNEGFPNEIPDLPGIWVVGSMEEFDADQWRDLFDEMGGGSNPSPISLSGIDVDIGDFAFLGRKFGKLSISARQSGGEWDANLSGNEIGGSVRWIPEGRGRIIGKFVNLGIPESPPGETPESKVAIAKVASRNLPALDITADSFVFNRKEVGKLELVATQQGNDWKIDRLKIVNPDSVLTADGLWQGWAIHPSTRVNVRLDVHKIGKFLARFGYPDNIMRGKGSMEGWLSWAGSPQSINYASLDGKIALSASHGQFNKIDPGIGKLLGILSLQELPRRITLDFRDIFSQGLAFDNISSNFEISKGIASTKNLRIQSPAAEVDMTGKIDLDHETQDLDILVKPQLGGSVSVASSLLGGPVVGIVTWVVGKALQDPLDQLASYEYNVTGSWSDPVVKKGHE